MTRFADPHYIDDYLATGRFPAIHDDLYCLVENFASEPEPALDIGACTGLLTLRLKQIRSHVIGLEANPAYIERSPAAKLLINLRVTLTTMGQVYELAKDCSLVVMRRVLPEICGDSSLVAWKLAERLHAAGVKKIALEGRVKSSRSTHLLASLEDEIAALSEFYTVSRRYKNCALLVRKDND